MDKTTQSDREIVFALLTARIKIERRLDRALSIAKGISLSEFLLMQALENEATATRVDLAAAVSLTPSGVTRALRPLEKLGYVTTKRDVRDARRSLASLTTHGGKLVTQASKIVDEVISDQRAVTELADADRKRISKFFHELTHGE